MNNEPLHKKKCVPCEGGTKPFERDEIEKYSALVKSWSVQQDREIRRNFVWKDFVQALQFVNAVGEIAESEGHHPDIFLHDWKEVEIRLTTHAIDGLSVNDFIMASKIDRIEMKVA